MNDPYSKSVEKHIEELIQLLKTHDINAKCIEEFLGRHQGKEYIGELQSVLDIKELLDAGLIK